jgi:hypothetical protein
MKIKKVRELNNEKEYSEQEILDLALSAVGED